MAKIYWFSINGDVKSGLEDRLVEFLQTDKKNWRSKVFYINSKEYEYDVNDTLLISNYIQRNGCDVVVSSYEELGLEDTSNIIFFDVIHNKLKKSDFVPTFDETSLEINTAMEGQSTSFNRIIHYILEKK
jgi:hypothetical protein